MFIQNIYSAQYYGRGIIVSPKSCIYDGPITPSHCELFERAVWNEYLQSYVFFPQDKYLIEETLRISISNTHYKRRKEIRKQICDEIKTHKQRTLHKQICRDIKSPIIIQLFYLNFELIDFL